MIVPAAGQIEAAMDMPALEEKWLKDQEKELRVAIGAMDADKLGVRYPLSKEFVKGYMMGLQTARAVLKLDPVLVQKEIPPGDLL